MESMQNETQEKTEKVHEKVDEKIGHIEVNISSTV